MQSEEKLASDGCSLGSTGVLGVLIQGHICRDTMYIIRYLIIGIMKLIQGPRIIVSPFINSYGT